MTVDFECGYRNLKAGFLFSTTNPIPAKGRIVLSTENTSDIWYFFVSSKVFFFKKYMIKVNLLISIYWHK